MDRQRSSFVRVDNENPDGSSSRQMPYKSIRGGLKKGFKKMQTLEFWRKTILVFCLAALGVDPMFLFVPEIDDKNFCLNFHTELAEAVCVIRTIIDTIYLIYIIFQFITKHLAPRSQKSFRGEFIVHSKSIRNIKHLFYSIVNILSVLPIPQVLVIKTITQQCDYLVEKRMIKWIILAQYIPRIIRIYPLYREVTRASGRVVETKWIGAGLNLALYILHGYVFGAFWYVSAVEMKNKCWVQKSSKLGRNLTDLYCARPGRSETHYLSSSCPLIDPDGITTNSTDFNFGMYIDALKLGVVDKQPGYFPRKFFCCFWWGLRNISSLGENLKTSNSVGDAIFGIIICLSGLLLFAVLIGNVQKYLQSTTIRADEMEEKARDLEKWMSSQRLPMYLKECIRSHMNYKWRETGGIKEDDILSSLPDDLREETAKHINNKKPRSVALQALGNQRDNTTDCSSLPHMSPPVLNEPADPKFPKNEA